MLHHQTLGKHYSIIFKGQTPLFFFFFIVLFLSNNTHLTYSQFFIYSGCSQEKFQPNTPYQSNLNSLLSSISSSSHTTLYKSFDLDTIYGLYQCRGDLNTRDCSACIASAIDQVVLLCPGAYGATLQLDRCLVRYEQVDFLGRPDDAIEYNKCSGSSIEDGEFLRRKDDVLDDLRRGAEGFRVSSLGSVEGYAQCLGDLSGGDCDSCLGDAVEKVRSLCGSAAAAAEVFLAQCYVRYWESGYYDHSSDSSNEDDAGKTIAIIVGVVAGVAVLIVLLSFCKKAIG